MSAEGTPANQKPIIGSQSEPPKESTPAPLTPQVSAKEEGPTLFHFAECTNCHHLLPISTNTEKYFAILTKDPTKVVGLGEKCARCGADSWVIVKV